MLLIRNRPKTKLEKEKEKYKTQKHTPLSTHQKQLAQQYEQAFSIKEHEGKSKMLKYQICSRTSLY